MILFKNKMYDIYKNFDLLVVQRPYKNPSMNKCGLVTT
jgi:hypothetical protein